ncbi:hypothetical protein Tco_0997819 [Tanacetum coccineum]
MDWPGLPLCAWGSNAYKKVAVMFGKFVFFKAEESTKMSSGRICISTKSYNFVSKRVLVEVHRVNYDVHVHELGTWNINIVDEKLDSSDNLDINGMEKMEDSVDENYLADLNDLKETINELASNKIQHPISKENMDQEDDINKVSPKIIVSSDLSRPPGFEHMKRTPKVAKALPDVCVTSIDHLWSDHNLILLHVSKSDFEPTPFKLFHSWILCDSFDEVIKTELLKLEEHNFGRKLLSHEKFHLLKARIKQ